MIKSLKRGLTFYMLVSIAPVASKRLRAIEVNDKSIESLKRGLAFDLLVPLALADSQRS